MQVVPAEDATMEDATSTAPPSKLTRETAPLCLSCAVIEDRLIADPSSEEEALAATLVSTTVDGQGHLIGVRKAL